MCRALVFSALAFSALLVLALPVGVLHAETAYDQAVKIVCETRRASVSGIQRRLKIGYNRAARMVEKMEATGLVGPSGPGGVREVLAQNR